VSHHHDVICQSIGPEQTVAATPATTRRFSFRENVYHITMPSDNERRLFAIAGDSDCDHDAARELGSDGANRFFECPDCGSALIKEGPTTDHQKATNEFGDMDSRLGDLLDDIDAYHKGEPTAFTSEKPDSFLDRLAAALGRLLP
jgi:hypothetical protein